MLRVCKILMLLVLTYALVRELACLVGDDDCCAPVACALCSASAVYGGAVAILQPPSILLATARIEFTHAATPDLSRLTPPPRPLA
jgi:hypothetical protein